MDIKGKIAIVTGASSGIGEAVAKFLTSKGAKVVLAARSKQKLEKLSHKLSDSLVVVTDMTKTKDIENLIQKTMKRFGRIDILINNAGRGYDAAVEYVDVSTFHEIFDLDVVGPLIAMQLVIPIMRKQGGGAIINISSGTALMILPNMSPYASLKRALAEISQTAHIELKKDHISVSVIYPYITKTDFEEHTIHGKEVKTEWDGGRKLPEFDPPEHVARKILEAVKTGSPEIYAHEWMRKPR